MRLRKAFTLVELLIVVAIIVLLISILITVFPTFDARLKQAICQSNLRSVHQVVVQYAAASNNRFPPFDHYYGIKIYHPYKWDDNRQPAVTPWQALSDARLMRQLGAGPESFFCPDYPAYGDYSNYAFNSWTEPSTSHQSGQWLAMVHFGYTFFINRADYIFGYTDGRVTTQTSLARADLPIAADVLKYRSNHAHTIGWYHGGLFNSSCNTLFLGGHVTHMEWPELEDAGPALSHLSPSSYRDDYWFDLGKR